MKEKKCSCRCHTWGKSCSGYGFGDKNCCSQPHVTFEVWKNRIDPIRKGELMTLFQVQAMEVYSEGDISHWISTMDIPEHIREVLHHEVRMIGLRCANFEDQCEFDVLGNKEWVLEVLEKNL